jgi:hypothetical protein
MQNNKLHHLTQNIQSSYMIYSNLYLKIYRLDFLEIKLTDVAPAYDFYSEKYQLPIN